MSNSDAATDSGSSYTSGTGDFVGTSDGSSQTDNGLSQDTSGVSTDGQTTTTAQSDAYIAQIAETTSAILSVNLVLVVAVFLCFGCMCVRTLIKSFEVR